MHTVVRKVYKCQISPLLRQMVETTVYFREGLLIEDVTVHDTFEEAALQLISNVAPSPEAESEMKKRFLS